MRAILAAAPRPSLFPTLQRSVPSRRVVLPWLSRADPRGGSDELAQKDLLIGAQSLWKNRKNFTS